MIKFVVAAEVAQDALCAHALADAGAQDLASNALCGYPSEHLTVMPEMTWEQVEERRRCIHCQQDWLALNAP